MEKNEKKTDGEQVLKYKFTKDTLFKILFVKNQDLLRSLVAALLGISRKSIRELTIANPEILPENLKGKFVRLDIHMNIGGKLVDLEIQVENEGDFPERSLYYWSRAYSTALDKNGQYKVLPQTIVISIIDFALFRCLGYKSEFRLLETDRHELLTDKLSLLYFELPKLSGDMDANNPLGLWLSLFNAKTEGDLIKIEQLGVPEMNKAISEYRNIVYSNEFTELERMRDKARVDGIYAIKNAVEKGVERERKRGNAKLKRALAEKDNLIKELQRHISELQKL